jgi:hypothetical protein
VQINSSLCTLLQAAFFAMAMEYSYVTISDENLSFTMMQNKFAPASHHPIWFIICLDIIKIIQILIKLFV